MYVFDICIAYCLSPIAYCHFLRSVGGNCTVTFRSQHHHARAVRESSTRSGTPSRRPTASQKETSTMAGRVLCLEQNTQNRASGQRSRDIMNNR